MSLSGEASPHQLRLASPQTGRAVRHAIQRRRHRPDPSGLPRHTPGGEQPGPPSTRRRLRRQQSHRRRIQRQSRRRRSHRRISPHPGDLNNTATTRRQRPRRPPRRGLFMPQQHHHDQRRHRPHPRRRSTRAEAFATALTQRGLTVLLPKRSTAGLSRSRHVATCFWWPDRTSADGEHTIR